jgi:hypothetical protein
MRLRSPLARSLNKLPILIVPLLAIGTLASGCAGSEPRPSSAHEGTARSTAYQSIGIVESIERGGEGRADDIGAYAIGVRFSTGNRETFTQKSIGRLRVGDRVLIAEGSVRPL